MFAPFGGGQGSPSPFQQGGSGPSHSLGSLLTLLTLLTLNVFAWYEMVSSRWISVKQTKQTKQRETRRESNSRPTVVRQSSDSRPTVVQQSRASGTNPAQWCLVTQRIGAMYLGSLMQLIACSLLRSGYTRLDNVTCMLTYVHISSD